MFKSVAGKPVPFTPRQFPTRLSRRVGLRTMGSIGAKKPCPSGEQIINGDFENGTTGWTFTSASEVREEHAHSPTHSVYTYSDGVGFYQSIDNLQVSCVQSLTFWTTAPYGGTATMWIQVTYSDGSSSTRDISTTGGYAERDVTDMLEAGKIITEIRFISSTDNPQHIDDVSLIC